MAAIGGVDLQRGELAVVMAIAMSSRVDRGDRGQVCDEISRGRKERDLSPLTPDRGPCSYTRSQPQLDIGDRHDNGKLARGFAGPFTERPRHYVAALAAGMYELAWSSSEAPTSLFAGPPSAARSVTGSTVLAQKWQASQDSQRYAAGPADCGLSSRTNKFADRQPEPSTLKSTTAIAAGCRLGLRRGQRQS